VNSEASSNDGNIEPGGNPAAALPCTATWVVPSSLSITGMRTTDSSCYEVNRTPNREVTGPTPRPSSCCGPYLVVVRTWSEPPEPAPSGAPSQQLSQIRWHREHWSLDRISISGPPHTRSEHRLARFARIDRPSAASRLSARRLRGGCVVVDDPGTAAAALAVEDRRYLAFRSLKKCVRSSPATANTAQK
jgi:hypothetical protein